MKKFALILFSTEDPAFRLIKIYEADNKEGAYEQIFNLNQFPQSSVERIIEITEGNKHMYLNL